MKKVLVIFGTRPEAIKMAPIVRALTESSVLKPVVCATAQHRDMLDQVIDFFKIPVEWDLNLMQNNQTLNSIVSRCTNSMQQEIHDTQPDLCLVQGDTTTAVASAFCAFNQRVHVGHIEAGLRTPNRKSPFPEEMNRRLLSHLADVHFAPTEKAVAQLLAEGIAKETVHLTGNTGIDAFLWAAQQSIEYPQLRDRYLGKKLILLTAHRRENFGRPLRDILGAIRDFMFDHEDFHLIYPVHPNPAVQSMAEELLGNVRRISLIPPASYGELIFLLKECHFLLTDSGGLQEEAPSLGKPILVLRENTERPEAVEAGAAKLVGSDPVLIRRSMNELAQPNSPLYAQMSVPRFPFGQGDSAKSIVRILEQKFNDGWAT